MKLIEAMKQIKDLQRKAEDLRKKIAVHCVDMSYETAVYPDQRAQVGSWLQAHGDIVKEILRLRVAIQRTNLATPVTGPRRVGSRAAGSGIYAPAGAKPLFL